MGIIRLLRAQVSRNRTGILTLSRTGAFQHRVYFLEGDIVAADSDAEDLRLGNVLYRLNKISLEQLEAAIERATGELQLGEILVEKGFLSTEERQACLSAQFQEVLNAVFLLEDAEYVFSPLETIFAENLQLFHDTETLIAAGERLRRTVDALTRDLEAHNHVYEIADQTFTASRREQEELLRYVDGRRNAEEIFQLSPFDRATTLHMMSLLLTQGVIREAEPPQDDDAPTAPGGRGSPPSGPTTAPAQPEDVSARTVVRVGRAGSEDIEAGLFFSSQSVLDRVDLSHVDDDRIARADHHGVVETLDAEDDDQEDFTAEEPPSSPEANRADLAHVSTRETGQPTPDAEEIAIEMDSEGDGLSEIFEGPSEEFARFETSDEEALLHVSTDDIEFQETQLDVPLPDYDGGRDDQAAPVEPGHPDPSSRPRPKPMLRHGFPEHPDVAEVTIEEEIDDEEYADILAKHLESMEGTPRVEDIAPQAESRIEAESRALNEDGGLVAGTLPSLDTDEPLFREPPVLNDLSDDEIVIESGLDGPGEEPLMETPEPLTSSKRRDGENAAGPLSQEQQDILDKITSLFKKPGARAAFGKTTEPWPTTAGRASASQRDDDVADDASLQALGATYNEIFATIFDHYRKKLGAGQTHQIFESFFMPGNSSFPELFIDVRFTDKGTLDVESMVHNLVAYGSHHPSEVFDACLNEVFYFLIRDIHLVLDQEEQDALMNAIMPVRNRLFQDGPARA